MVDARLIYDQKTRFLDGRLEVRITAYEVPKNKKFPDTKLPQDKAVRMAIDVRDYQEAIEFFINEVLKAVRAMQNEN